VNAVAVVATCFFALAAAPRQLALRRVEGDSLHLAGRAGAINTRGSQALTIELKADGTLTAKGAGSRSKHNLYETFSTDDATVWTTTWHGTWTEAKGGLRLDLVLEAKSCTRTRSQTGAAAETLACRIPSARALMACLRAPVEFHSASKSADRPVEAWRCSLESGSVGEWATPWLFGDGSCVETLASRSGLRYAACAHPGDTEP
jgi:hypothetical protein